MSKIIHLTSLDNVALTPLLHCIAQHPTPYTPLNTFYIPVLHSLACSLCICRTPACNTLLSTTGLSFMLPQFRHHIFQKSSLIFQKSCMKSPPVASQHLEYHIMLRITLYHKWLFTSLAPPRSAETIFVLLTAISPSTQQMLFSAISKKRNIF